MSTNFRQQLIEPSAREEFIFFTFVEREDIFFSRFIDSINVNYSRKGGNRGNSNDDLRLKAMLLLGIFFRKSF